MPPMTYACFLLGGVQAVEWVRRLADCIALNNLSDDLPCIRIEKGAHFANQFYLFIGINPNSGTVLPTSASIITQLLRKQPQYVPHREIVGMVGTETLTNVLAYRPPEASFDDPLEWSAEPDSDAAPHEGSGAFDRLILLLSALGAGRWDRFADLCAALGITTEDGPRASHVMRRLGLLGHIGTNANRDRWSVAPTVLARVDPLAHEDGVTHVLCGSRDPELIQQLARCTDVLPAIPHPSDGGPPVIGIRAPDETALRDALSSNGDRLSTITVAGSSIELAQAVPDLEGWRDALPTIGGVSPDMFSCSWFNGVGFTPRYFDQTSGLWELVRREDDGGFRPIRRNYYYDATTQRWLGGDFYGLRFLTTSDHARPQVRHNVSTLTLDIDIRQRWPELFERVLVLASGRLPDRAGGAHPFLRYRGISTTLLDILAEKLHLEVLTVNE